jgi:hypothetical protein
MRFLPTRVHGVIDYVTGVLLVAAPWLLAFARGGAETWVPVILGTGGIAYSLFTDYELGVVRRLGMPAHLGLDAVLGALLASSPWLFGFADRVASPHVGFGILAIGAALVTRTVADDRRAAVG